MKVIELANQNVDTALQILYRTPMSQLDAYEFKKWINLRVKEIELISQQYKECNENQEKINELYNVQLEFPLINRKIVDKIALIAPADLDALEPLLTPKE